MKYLPALQGNIILIIVLAIVVFLISEIIFLAIIRLTLNCPPVRHLTQAIYQIISDRD